MNWTIKATAASAGLLRFPAHKHFPSDILIGSTLGYVSGSWSGEQSCTATEHPHDSPQTQQHRSNTCRQHLKTVTFTIGRRQKRNGEKPGQ
jgi:hypothetical protein